MEIQNTPYRRQIFVCTHNANGEKACCADHEGEQIFKELREIAKQKKLHPMIRVAQAKCLGQCEKGANIMIYPENIYLSKVVLTDIPAIAQKYIVSD